MGNELEPCCNPFAPNDIELTKDDSFFDDDIIEKLYDSKFRIPTTGLKTLRYNPKIRMAAFIVLTSGPLVIYVLDVINIILTITSSNTVDIAIGVAMFLNFYFMPLLLSTYVCINREKCEMVSKMESFMARDRN